MADALRTRHGSQSRSTTRWATPRPATAWWPRCARGERDVVGVCNSAGFSTYGRFQDIDPEREGAGRVSVDAVHHLTGAFLPGMLTAAPARSSTWPRRAFQPLLPDDLRRHQGVRARLLRACTDLKGTGWCAALCRCNRTEFARSRAWRSSTKPRPLLAERRRGRPRRHRGHARRAAQCCPASRTRPRPTRRLAPRSVLLPVMRAVWGRGPALREHCPLR
jgi:hypothetical protein